MLTLKEIAKAVNGKLCGDENIVITGISTDTREDLSSKLFVALKGNNFDAHDYIDKAFEKGALCCISEVQKQYEKPVVYVKSTAKALVDLAAYYRSLFNIPAVAVTGSTGKTTTKDMIASVLEQKYNVLKTKGNYNNEIGLPLTIFGLNQHHNMIVLEMGMNHFGEIHNLSFIAKPDVAVITNIGVSHIENLGSRDGILKAKSEIFDYLKPDGLAVLNAEDDMLKTIEHKDLKIVWYGKEIYATDIIQNDIKDVKCTIHTKNGKFSVVIPQAGYHMVLNALAATAVGQIFGLSIDQIKKGIEHFVPAKSRMNIIQTDQGIRVINDVYNSSPDSVKSAINVLKRVKGRKVCILGDMLELGDFAMEMHRDIGTYVKENQIELTICIGELARYIYEENKDKSKYFDTKEEFIKDYKQNLKSGDTVLVKASRGMLFEKIVEEITR